MIRLLPFGWALFIGRLLGLFWYYVIPFRRDVALSNVTRSVGRDLTPRQRRRIVRRSFQRQGMYFIEVLRLPALTAELSEELIEQQNFEVIDAALARGKGVILVATHLDNVDLGGCSISVSGRPITVPAKNVSWKPAAKFIVAVRERTGVELIPTKHSMKLIRKRLAENRIVGLVIDQHLRPQHAIVCSFFDQLAATTHAPARLAAETGAALITTLAYRKGMTRYHVIRADEFEVETPHDDAAADARHNTERLNRIVEGWIREFPDQWLWPHLRWKVHDSPEGWEIPDDLRPLLDSGAPFPRKR